MFSRFSSYYEKFADGTTVCIDDEIPFDVPKGWEWCRINHIANIQSSKRVFEKDYVSNGIPFFRSKEIGDLSRNEIIHTKLYISKELYEDLKTKYGVPQVGDILLTSVGSIGNYWICDGREFYYKDGNITQICSNVFFDSTYLTLFLGSPFFFQQITSSVSGTAYNALTIIKLKSLLFPLPPLAEQHRIVEKIQKLLPIVEQYDSAQSKLDSLNTNINELLKKSILQEAIQGKLVPQDPNDEPASSLLEKIKAEKARLVVEGKLKKKDVIDSTIFRGDDNKYYEQIDKTVTDITDEIPFDIPDSWEWKRLGNICELIGGYAFPSESLKANKGIRVIRISDISECGFVNNRIVRYNGDENLLTYNIQLGDILMAMTGGTVGKSLYVTLLPEPMLLNQRVVIIRNKFMNKNYMNYVITAPHIKSIINEKKNSTNDNISMKDIYNFLIPVPPIEEQRLIVKTIESAFNEIKG